MGILVAIVGVNGKWIIIIIIVVVVAAAAAAAAAVVAVVRGGDFPVGEFSQTLAPLVESIVWTRITRVVAYKWYY